MKTEVRTRDVEVTRMVAETRTRLVVKDGKNVPETYTVYRPVKERVRKEYTIVVPGGIKISHIQAKQIQVWNLEGKRVETDEWLKLLEKPRHVFVLGQPLPQERSPVDAFYRGVLKEDTLFVFSPQLVAPREQVEDAPAGNDAPAGGIFQR